MPEESIVRVCAPTLAGLKTGSIVTCAHDGKKEMNGAISDLNRRLRGKGLLAVPLKWTDRSMILYFYRPKQLERDLSDAHAEKILKRKGYSGTGVNRRIAELIERLRGAEDFPHEIGLFLGYPPEDVAGFIENHAEDSKCTGCWKVYGDVESAKKRFECYKKCSRVYSECYRRGVPFEKLVVKTV